MTEVQKITFYTQNKMALQDKIFPKVSNWNEISYFPHGSVAETSSSRWLLLPIPKRKPFAEIHNSIRPRYVKIASHLIQSRAEDLRQIIQNLFVTFLKSQWSLKSNVRTEISGEIVIFVHNACKFSRQTEMYIGLNYTHDILSPFWPFWGMIS